MKTFSFRKICSILSPKICASLSALAILITGIGSVSGQSSTSVLIGAEYIVSNATVTVQWDLVSIALAYEARLTMFDKDPITYFALARIPGNENSVVFTRPRAGHFRAEVRACRFADCHLADPDKPEDDLSRWAESTNKGDACVDELNDGNCVPMAWWIYWEVPPPILE